MADDLPPLIAGAQMMGKPRPFGILMGKSGRFPRFHQPRHRAPGGAATFRIELAKQLQQPDPSSVVLADPRLSAERGAAPRRAGAVLQSPRALPLFSPPPAPPATPPSAPPPG